MDGNYIFIGMVFVAAVLLAQGLIVPAFGESRQVRKRLEQRLAQIDRSQELEGITSILREKYLAELSPLEKWMETLPMMEDLTALIEQGGHSYRAYRVVFLAIALGIGGSFAIWSLTRIELLALATLLAGFAMPFFKLRMDRNTRFSRFEEQLPDAIDVMRRALMAGHPFNASIQLVAEDMEEPIGGELQQTFNDINYGNDVRRAMLGLLARVPSVTVMALVTSVLVQRETGGNLAEVLEQIAGVIRSRFRFHRRVKTLSAEGRMSAWVLAAVPLALFAVMSALTPDYFPVLLESEIGKQLVTFTFFWACIGIYFLRKIIRIDV